MPAGKIYVAARAKPRRKVYAKRRSYLKRTIRSRVPMLNVTRTFRWFHWTPSTTSTVDFWNYFQIRLTDIPNNAEYIALFDQYKINSLTFKLVPRYDSFEGNNTTDTTLPGVTNQGGCMTHVIIDPASTITPSGLYTSANLNTFLENGRCKTYMGNRPITFKVKYPMWLNDVNNTTLSEYERSRFFSTTNSLIGLRGAHVFMQDVNLTGNFGQSFDVFVTANMTFKGMK